MLFYYQYSCEVSVRHCFCRVNGTFNFISSAGFDVGVNKQVMSEVSGLVLGPPRLPVLPCPISKAQAIAQKIKDFSQRH